MSKILVKGFIDPILINLSHTTHFLDLYKGYYLKLIKEDRKVQKGEIDELREELDRQFLEEFSKWHSSWATEELLKIGLVTIYHLWEKQIIKLIDAQLELLNLKVNKKRGSLGIVGWAREILEEKFECFVEKEIWDSINKCRLIVNSYKHGNKESYQKLYKIFPDLFVQYEMTDKEIDELFLLGEENFNSIGNSFSRFWETLPHKKDYSSF